MTIERQRNRLMDYCGAVMLVLVSANASALNLANEPLFVTAPVKPNVILASTIQAVWIPRSCFRRTTERFGGILTTRALLGWAATTRLKPGMPSITIMTGTQMTIWKKYVYLFPIGKGTGRRGFTETTMHDHFAIPPRPEFAFARSAEYNKAYYDPRKTYEPWPSYSGQDFPDSLPTAARTDPIFGAVTIDLTQELSSSDANWKFKLQPGMRNSDGNVVSNDQEATIAYFPATYYTVDASGICSSPSPSDYTTFVANPTVLPVGVDAIGPDGKCLVKYQIKDGNSFPSGRTYEQELQNFANWFTYYRKRHLAMRGSTLSAFNKVSGIRTGVFGFNNQPSTLAIFDLDTERASVFDELKSLVNNGGTPTRQALDYLGGQFERTGDSAPITLKCQKNFAILFTDGFAVPKSGLVGNVDVDAGPPYADNFNGTLGDIAMHYYDTNLRPDLTPGQVPVSSACRGASPNPLLDCNKNLHMVTYSVGLGVQGTLFGRGYETRCRCP